MYIHFTHDPFVYHISHSQIICGDGTVSLEFSWCQIPLSERFTQDPLESFFGQQRQRGGGSDNPNVLQFIYTTSSIRAHKAISPTVHGNVRGSKHHKGNEESFEIPLPKRPRKQKHT